MSDSIQATLDEVTRRNTENKKDVPATWGDIQDLRRGLQGYIDVKIDSKIDGLKEDMIARFDDVDRRFNDIDARLNAIQKLLEEKQ